MTIENEIEYCHCFNAYCEVCIEEYEQQTEANIEEEKLPF